MFLSYLPVLLFMEMVISSFALSSQHATKEIKATSKIMPEKVLVAYTSNNCHDLNKMEKVTSAIKNGVNVLIWVFVAFEVVDGDVGDIDQNTLKRIIPQVSDSLKGQRLGLKSNLDVQNYKWYRKHLHAMGYENVIHLVAFGGWNGPHLPAGFTAKELYDAFQAYNLQEMDDERLFDGIDWDLEGHDNLNSPTNVFTIECLDQMGEFSAMAKDDGYFVSIAPPESYLDITSNKFSRFLNLTYNDPWHEEFQYHGSNAYGYLLAKWNDVIDFIFLQFYESFSHAAYQIFRLGQDPSDVLINYANYLSKQGEGLFIHFEDDASVHLKNQFVPLPLSKLVFGFANGWAKNDDLQEKTVFFERRFIQRAYEILSRNGKEPRGLGFWVVEEEGAHGIEYAKDLNSILHLQLHESLMQQDQSET